MSKNKPLTFEKTNIDLSLLEPEKQYEFFADEVCRKIIQHESRLIDDRKDFPSRFESLEIGQSCCIDITSPIHSIERTKKTYCRG